VTSSRTRAQSIRLLQTKLRKLLLLLLLNALLQLKAKSQRSTLAQSIPSWPPTQRQESRHLRAKLLLMKAISRVTQTQSADLTLDLVLLKLPSQMLRLISLRTHRSSPRTRTQSPPLRPEWQLQSPMMWLKPRTLLPTHRGSPQTLWK